MLAASFADVLWPLLLLLGLEKVAIEPGNTKFTPLSFISYPWSHSLVMLCIWGALLGGFYFAIRKDLRAALLVGALVVSHWALDWISHRPDMPLTTEGSDKYGLSLWNNVPATLIVESIMFGAGVWIYLTFTRARNKVGSIGMWAYAAFYVVAYVANALGPPPPSVNAIAITCLVGSLTAFWAHWADKNRDVLAA